MPTDRAVVLRKTQQSGMDKTLTVDGLSAANKALVTLMQKIHFGRIKELRVRHGEPVMEPPPRVVREIRFGIENGPKRRVKRNAFTLKAQVCDLLAQLEALGEGTVKCIDIQDGLPFRMIVEEVRA